MRTLGPTLQLAHKLLHQGKAWLFFLEIPAAGGSWFRLVRASRHVVANGKIWTAAAIDIQPPEEDAEGSLGELVITVPNVSRLPLTYVEVDGLILGKEVTLWLQHEGSLAQFEPSLSWRHVVLSCRATEASITFSCGHPAEIQRVPSVRFDRATFPQLLPAGGFRL